VKILLEIFPTLQTFLEYLHNSSEASAKVVHWYAYPEFGKLYFHMAPQIGTYENYNR
jgi:hypothetical protein